MAAAEHPHTQGNDTKANSIASIERATEKTWQTWLQVFGAANAENLAHPEIVSLVRAELPLTLQNPDWWAQGVAIAFEQHAGLRVPGQSSTGEYRVGASRTVQFERDAAIERWVQLWGEADHLGQPVFNVRRSRTEKRTFWRAQLGDVGKLEVAAAAKGDDKAIVSTELTRLRSPDQIGEWRAHLKQCLAAL